MPDRIHFRISLRATLAVWIASALTSFLPVSPSWAQGNAAFSDWLTGVRQEALARGIRAEIFDAALSNAIPIERVIEFDRRQPEFLDTFWNYLDRRVTPGRIEAGRARLREHAALFAEIESRYRVPARFLVAFWGLETNYGGHLGGFSVPRALATLAFEGRRGEFFRAELLRALEILEAGHVAPGAMVGSWAGAMGQMQFMPSTFVHHAVDGDGDGRIDLWESVPDAMASAGNFLRALGWRESEPWGREVRLSAGFDVRHSGLDVKKDLAEWATLGVTQADGKPLPKADLRAALILPQGHAGPAFLVYRNFEIILSWNRSIHYALTVGHLADRLVGLPPLTSGRGADNRRMSVAQGVELQIRLARLGYDPGEADGVMGARTRAAIRAYQIDRGLPGDGFASIDLLERLREETPALAMPPRQDDMDGGRAG